MLPSSENALDRPVATLLPRIDLDALFTQLQLATPRPPRTDARLCFYGRYRDLHPLASITDDDEKEKQLRTYVQFASNLQEFQDDGWPLRALYISDIYAVGGQYAYMDELDRRKRAEKAKQATKEKASRRHSILRGRLASGGSAKHYLSEADDETRARRPRKQRKLVRVGTRSGQAGSRDAQPGADM